MNPRSRIAFFVVGLGLLAALGVAGCFSTIEPDREPTTGPNGNDPTIAIVRGELFLYRGPGDRESWRGQMIRVRWFSKEENFLGKEIILSGNMPNANNGSFIATFADPRTSKVEIAALRCDIFPEELDIPACCLTGAICTGCESAWDTAYTMPVVLGAVATRTLSIYCEQSMPQMKRLQR